MARNKTIKILRTTRAALDSNASAGNLLAGEPYLITDENRIAVGLSTTTYETYAKASEAVGNIVNGGQNGALIIGSLDNNSVTLKTWGESRYIAKYGKANILLGSYGLVDANSTYAVSIQNNLSSCWLEILNNGGSGKGAFFGMSGNDFQLWSYQKGHTTFYVQDGTTGTDYVMLQLRNDGDISMGRNHKVVLDFSNITTGRIIQFPDKNCVLGDVANGAQAGAVGVGSIDSTLTLKANGMSVLHATTGGYVGIGDNFTAPQSQLHVHEPVGLSGCVAKFTRGSQTGASDGAEFGQDSSNNAYLKSFAGNLLAYRGNDVGAIPAVAFCIQRTAYTLTSSTSLQKAFNPTTNGALTVAAGTTYFFECSLNLSSMSATSGNFGFSVLGAGTATLTSAAWHAIGLDATTQTTAAAIGGVFSASAGATGNIVTDGTGTAASVKITGTFTVNAGGTIIPSLQLTTAAAAVVGVNSWFRCTPVCASGSSYIGNWS